MGLRNLVPELKHSDPIELRTSGNREKGDKMPFLNKIFQQVAQVMEKILGKYLTW